MLFSFCSIMWDGNCEARQLQFGRTDLLDLHPSQDVLNCWGFFIRILLSTRAEHCCSKSEPEEIIKLALEGRAFMCLRPTFFKVTRVVIKIVTLWYLYESSGKWLSRRQPINIWLLSYPEGLFLVIVGKWYVAFTLQNAWAVNILSIVRPW